MKTSNISQSFFIGSLLAFVGGYLDAYTYISRGHVFANAQTGNIVLLGIGVVNNNIQKVFYYLMPILSFVLGVIIAEYIKYKFKNHPQLYWRQVVILFEAVTLLGVAFIPAKTGDMLANCLVSFVCSLQVQSFRKLNGNPYATTMCTGNLRSGTEKLFQSVVYKDKQLRSYSIQYFSIILLFILGAGIGALLTDLFYEKSVILCAILLVFICFVLRPQNQKLILTQECES